MKIGLFEHGGQTRTILSIEIGRAAARDTKATSGADVIRYVTDWLEANQVPCALPDARRKLTRKQEMVEELAGSDLTAQAVGREDIEYGLHTELPRGEHVARVKRR